MQSSSLNDALTAELEKLQRKTGFGSRFTICVADPSENPAVEGQVTGDVITIYSRSKDHAIKVLHHEFIDAMVVEAIRPYQHLANLQRAAVNAMLTQIQDGAYQEKEKVVESLLRLVE